MKKQKIFIIINLALFFTMLNQNNIVIASSYNPPVIINSIIEITDKNSNQIKNKKNKKNDIVIIKKQIQERRKLHRNLIQEYNVTFNNTILTDITSNAIQIEQLLTIKESLIRNKKELI